MMQQPQHLSSAKDVEVWALLVIPAIAIASLLAFIAIFAKWGIVVAVTFWFVLMAALIGWSQKQLRRAQREIRSQIERSGCKVMKMNHRYVRLGAFSMWNTSRSQLVYRVVVREIEGRERIVWARWGRRWFWNTDRLELRWQD